MSNINKFNRRTIEFTPPEAVAISFAIAPFGSRVGAQMLDLLITGFALSLVIFLLLWSWIFPVSVSIFIVLILSFLTRVPYYVLSELVWNGRTLGKRLVGIRVINKDGRRLTPHQIVARNLMKEVEFFSPFIAVVFLGDIFSFWGGIVMVWITVLLVVVLSNRSRQRLGDMIAGTIVVQNPRAKLLPDLAIENKMRERRFDFIGEHLDIYGRFELQTLENILRLPKGQHDTAELRKIVQTIIRKISYTDPIHAGEELLFLHEFYRAQREYLEKLRLFGKKRENKHHAQGKHFAFFPTHLNIYGHFELKTLENIVQRPQEQHNTAELQKITQAIIKKINYTTPVHAGEEFDFLYAFYHAQRQYLEKLRLLGEQRDNKHQVQKMKKS